MREGEYTHAPKTSAGSVQMGIYSLPSGDSLFVVPWAKARAPGFLSSIIHTLKITPDESLFYLESSRPWKF